MIGPVVWGERVFFVSDDLKSATMLVGFERYMPVTNLTILDGVVGFLKGEEDQIAAFELMKNELPFRLRRRWDAFMATMDMLHSMGDARQLNDGRFEVDVSQKEFADMMAQSQVGIWGETENRVDLLRKLPWSRNIVWPKMQGDKDKE